MKRKMSKDKKVIQKIDILADKALGPREQLRDAQKIKRVAAKKKGK